MNESLEETLLAKRKLWLVKGRLKGQCWSTVCTQCLFKVLCIYCECSLLKLFLTFWFFFFFLQFLSRFLTLPPNTVQFKLCVSLIVHIYPTGQVGPGTWWHCPGTPHWTGGCRQKCRNEQKFSWVSWKWWSEVILRLQQMIVLTDF